LKIKGGLEPVQNWFTKFCLAENQNQTNMSEARTKPEPNQNQGSVQVILVLCASSELNFSIHCWRWVVFPLEKPIKRHIL